MQKSKLCILVTASLSIRSLYQGQIRNLVNNGFDVTFISSAGKESKLIAEEGGKFISIDIKRTPALVSDFLSFIRLFFHFLTNRYDLVVYSTPKASLLGAFATFLTFQKNTIYIVRGRAYEGYSGLKRSFFIFLDKVTCLLSSKVQFISHEMLKAYVDDKICSEKKSFILGMGSSKGVDVSHFSRERFSEDYISERRIDLGISNDDFLWIYCGRIRREKGINELVAAFDKVLADNSKQKLMLVGPYEEWDPLDDDVLFQIKNNPNIIHLDWVDDVSEYMALAQAFVFPSYREGFGNVAIEAASMNLPVITFDVIGCRESVASNVSGIVVDNISVDELMLAMKALLGDREMLSRLSLQARDWAVSNFDRNKILSENVALYKKTIGNV